MELEGLRPTKARGGMGGRAFTTTKEEALLWRRAMTKLYGSSWDLRRKSGAGNGGVQPGVSGDAVPVTPAPRARPLDLGERTPSDGMRTAAGSVPVSPTAVVLREERTPGSESLPSNASGLRFKAMQFDPEKENLIRKKVN